VNSDRGNSVALVITILTSSTPYHNLSTVVIATTPTTQTGGQP